MKTKGCVSMKTIVITCLFCQIFSITYFICKSNITAQADKSAHRETIAPKQEANKSTQHHAKVNSLFTIIPQIPKNTSLLIAITTIPSKFERRQTLRETWAKMTSLAINATSPSFKPLEKMMIAYFFFVGFDGHSSIDTNTKREADVQKDILGVYLNESYRSLHKKVLLTFEWVANLDIKPRFIVKVDDDMYIKVPDLARWLLGSTVQSVKRLYAGRVFHRNRVIRVPNHRWYVSSEQYENNFFPAYCTGGFYVLSRNLLLEIVNASKVTKLFPVEDAYIGVLVNKVGATPMEIGQNLVDLIDRANRRVLAGKQEIPSAIVVGHSLSSEAIRKLHHTYCNIGNHLNPAPNM